MSRRYWQAVTVAAIGLATVVWGVVDPGQVSTVGLLVGAASVPLGVLLAISGRLDRTVPVSSLVGGGTIGPAVALLSHSVVFAFAYFFFFGFAEEAASLLEAFRIDPALVEVAGSPWTLLLLIEVVVVAPFTEEVGKAVGGYVSRPKTRRDAFMAGVAAGVGFAIVENILYATSGFFTGQDWQIIVAIRMVGAAVHPLASGIVVLGWWEWKQGRDAGLLAKRFLTGVGVHALWNGALVAMAVVGEAFGIDSLTDLGALGLVYSAGLGVIAFGILWRLSKSVAEEDRLSLAFDLTDARTIGAWSVLAASLLVPTALVFIAYPHWAG